MDYRDYLNYAEKYLLLAETEAEQEKDVTWLLTPATILAWAAIEAFVNNMLEDFGSLPEDMFDLHERAFLLEKRLVFLDTGERAGQFDLVGSEYRGIADKVLFLLAKFGTRAGQQIKGTGLWQNFQELKRVRDALMHPSRSKEVPLDVVRTRGFIETAQEVIRMISQHVWGHKVQF